MCRSQASLGTEKIPVTRFDPPITKEHEFARIKPTVGEQACSRSGRRERVRSPTKERSQKISLARLPAAFTLSPSMSSAVPPAARADASLEGETLTVGIGGDWRITDKQLH